MEIGRVPTLIGKRSRNMDAQPWYIDLIKYNQIRDLVKGVKAAPIWLLDDTALFDNKSVDHALDEAWSFTNEKGVHTGDHGTHLAGIAACLKYGLFPENIKISTAKVLRSDTGFGRAEWIRSGIMSGIKKGYEVFNFSIGSNSPDAVLKRAFSELCSNKKRFAVCASGNDDRTDFPAAFNISGIISVGSIEQDGSFKIRLASYSSVGKVTVCMPGTDILSTVPGNRHEYMSGTSMATMFVTSLIAVAKGLNPEFNHQMFFDLVKKHAIPVSGKTEAEVGVGFLNVVEFIKDVKNAQPSRRWFQKIF